MYSTMPMVAIQKGGDQLGIEPSRSYRTDAGSGEYMAPMDTIARPAQRTGVHVADGPVGVVRQRIHGLDRHHRTFEGGHAVEGQREVIMNFRIGSVTQFVPCAGQVMMPLIMPPQRASRIREKTACRSTGSSQAARVVQVVRARPHVE